MKSAAPYFVVLLAGIAIGWILGSLGQAERGSSPPAPGSRAPESAPDPEIGPLREEVALLRAGKAELERQLAETRAAVAGGSASAGPVRLAEETGDPAHATIRVLVTGPDGVPLADRSVRSWRLENGTNVDNRDARTDAFGAATFPDLAPGTRFVNLVLPGGLTTVRAEAPGGRVTEVVIPLAAGSVVAGTVTHAERGPLAKVQVSLNREDGAFRTYFTATTDEDGRYRFEEVPPGAWSVAVSGGSLGYGRTRSESVVVPEGGGTVTKDFQLGGAGLTGRMVDRETGRPIAGVRIDVQGGAPYRSVNSDAEGRYRLEDIGPATVRLCLSRDGYGVLFQSVEVSADGKEQDFELLPAATLFLDVTDPEGRPFTGSIFFSILPKDRTAKDVTSVGTSVVAGPEGTAVYRRILPGEYSLTLKAEGIGEAKVEVRVERGENRVAVRLALP